MLQPLLNSRFHQQAINHHLNGVVLALVELDIVQFFVKVPQLAINAGAHVAMLHQLGHLLLEFAFTPAYQRGQHHHPLFRLELHHPLHNLLR